MLVRLIDGNKHIIPFIYLFILLKIRKFSSEFETQEIRL